MNSKEILDALGAARTFKPTPDSQQPIHISVKDEFSFVSVYDQLEQMDRNPFGVDKLK